jgi:hypothetical protein
MLAFVAAESQVRNFNYKTDIIQAPERGVRGWVRRIFGSYVAALCVIRKGIMGRKLDNLSLLIVFSVKPEPNRELLTT